MNWFKNRKSRKQALLYPVSTQLPENKKMYAKDMFLKGHVQVFDKITGDYLETKQETRAQPELSEAEAEALHQAYLAEWKTREQEWLNRSNPDRLQLSLF